SSYGLKSKDLEWNIFAGERALRHEIGHALHSQIENVYEFPKDAKDRLVYREFYADKYAEQVWGSSYNKQMSDNLPRDFWGAKSLRDNANKDTFSVPLILGKKHKRNADYLNNEIAFNKMYKLADNSHIKILNELDKMNDNLKVTVK
ncbi:MAG: hypothetical protein ACE5ES_05710, partial [Candidatus Nanoarchaeia archaeon]